MIQKKSVQKSVQSQFKGKIALSNQFQSEFSKILNF